MFQRFPGSSTDQTPTGGPSAAPPPTILNAVKLMYAGASIMLVYLIVDLITASGLKSTVRRLEPKWTTSHIDSYVHGLVLSTVVIMLIGIGLWLWMAWANKQGKAWARIVATVLCGLYTLYMVLVVSQVRSAFLIFPLASWIVGIAAAYLLWRPVSTAYIQSRSALPLR